MPTRPSQATTDRLWGLAGGECAHPQCEAEILNIDEKEGESSVITKVGRVAHIHGSKKGSNRWLETQTDDERHGFDNLLILCGPHHDIVDNKDNEERYPAELLRRWKQQHLEKVRLTRDRNWICHPNSATLFNDGISTQTTYWIDQQGRPRLYTSEQLAVINQLQPLVWDISRIQQILKQLEDTQGKPDDPSHQTMNDAIVGQLYRDVRHIKKNDYGWIGYLTETMQVAQDVTLGELFLMMIKNGLADREKHVQEGYRLLRDKAAQTDPLPKSTVVKPPEDKGS